ncbi:MAG: methyltransferase domain-containing protein [Simkaniaceae bacterium]|nr:methyltransferase domain-containing protein [Candidatus Sacchlamyda saccharinae]
MREVIDEYDPEYCHSLEAVYGKGMMSEGGAEGIDFMFKDLPIQGKKALDIGCGLGGVAYHLATKYEMDVTGLEINSWMVKEAERNTPAEIKPRLTFVLSTNNASLPFENDSFDIVYSKGVLCHVENKRELFKECHRILKPGGLLVINDWLSPTKGKWGGYVQRLVELEGLSLYAESIEGYLEVLGEAQFTDVEVLDLTEKYAQYNEEIVRELKKPEKEEAFIRSFSQQLHKEAIEGYDAIARAMRTGEGLVTQFTAIKR